MDSQFKDHINLTNSYPSDLGHFFLQDYAPQNPKFHRLDSFFILFFQILRKIRKKLN